MDRGSEREGGSGGGRKVSGVGLQGGGYLEGWRQGQCPGLGEGEAVREARSSLGLEGRGG